MIAPPATTRKIRGESEKIAVPETGYPTLEALLAAVRNCRACEAHLPLGPRPVLRAAQQQPEPQRLLFVFAGAVLPDDSTPEQRARFEARQGGALTPLMSVDKTPEELGTFAALVEESRQFGRDWAIVFVASLPGRDGRAPTSKHVGFRPWSAN